VGMEIRWGSPWVWVWSGYGDDLPSPQTHGDFMGIFNQPEILRETRDKRCMFEFYRISTMCYFTVSLYFCIILTEGV